MVSSSNLSADFLTEILSRLPVKSLARFKCVSKAWHYLISELTSLQRKPLTLSGLFYYEFVMPKVPPQPYPFQEYEYTPLVDACDGAIDTSLSFLPCHHTLQIIDSCNGLLLCQKHLHCERYVCNPVTKRWAQIPQPPTELDYDTQFLAFDPNNSPYYKVVCFSIGSSNGFYHLKPMVFCSRQQKWLRSKASTVRKPCRPSIFLNGVLYMLIRLDQVAAFDVEEDNYWLLNLPDRKKFGISEFLGKCSSRLCYFKFNMSDFKIWILEDCKSNEWVLKHCIRNEALLAKCPVSMNFYYGECCPLAFNSDSYNFFLLIEHKLFLYDLDTELLEEVCSLESDFVFWCRFFPFSACPFVDAFKNNH